MDSFQNLSMSESKLIVGIDFGTTFSGLAWTETRRPDTLTIVNVWPASLGTNEGATEDKVPTELRYTPEGLEWGFQIPPMIERYQWFKLGLARSRAVTAGELKSPEQLASDYLQALCKHLEYHLEQKLGESVMRTTAMEICLTVPAIWSEIAKEKTLKACSDTGLNISASGIHLVTEPEAAAIHALNGLEPHRLKIGDSFVLCDAGGGTVDLISYTITQLKPILQVKEAAPGTGGLCGSTFLNRRFGQFLENKLGKLEGWDEEIMSDAMQRFDSVMKKSYLPSDTKQEDYTVIVPGMADSVSLGIRRGRMKISAEEMSGIFDPIIEKVIALTQSQIRNTKMPVRTVLLVGGFGQNNYLKQRLRAALGPAVEILQPPNAWTAVVRGAVMMGLARADSALTAVGMASRSARKHYGITLNYAFDKSAHDETKKYWCTRDCRYKVPVMDWFINRGDAVEQDQTKQITFDSAFLVVNGRPSWHSVSVKCDDRSALAPIHPNGNERTLVRLNADLSSLSEADLRASIRRCADGQNWYLISGAVEATYHSASTSYVLLYRGTRYNTVTAEYV